MSKVDLVDDYDHRDAALVDALDDLGRTVASLGSVRHAESHRRRSRLRSRNFIIDFPATCTRASEYPALSECKRSEILARDGTRDAVARDSALSGDDRVFADQGVHQRSICPHWGCR